MIGNPLAWLIGSNDLRAVLPEDGKELAMFDRFVCRALVVAGLALSLAGCGNPTGLDSIAVTPGAQSMAVGQTTQFTATGTFGNANHASTQNITSSVTWSSSNTSVAT